MEPFPNIPLKLNEKHRKAGGFACIVIIALALFIHAWSSMPVSLGNRLSLAAGFIGRFNEAALQKLRLDEKKYQSTMCKALLFNRDDFIWFANSAYWAYFADERTIRWTERKGAAQNELNLLSKERMLAADFRLE